MSENKLEWLVSVQTFSPSGVATNDPRVFGPFTDSAASKFEAKVDREYGSRIRSMDRLEYYTPSELHSMLGETDAERDAKSVSIEVTSSRRTKKGASK